MDGEGAHNNVNVVEEVFKDFKGRRAGLIKALTTDVDEFRQLCDPEKENLCLYGYPNGQWEVNLPVEEVPPELPEPVLGINFSRDGMVEKDWLSLIAVHTDSWLLSVASFFGAKFGFNKTDRKRLFNKINELPTIFEVVTDDAESKAKEKLNVRNNGGSNSKSKSKRGASKPAPKEEEEEKEDDAGMEEEGAEKDLEEDDEQGDTFCGACGENYPTEGFWICCDVCEVWYHGKCVKITPGRAQRIKHYKCPACCNKKQRT